MSDQGLDLGVMLMDEMVKHPLEHPSVGATVSPVGVRCAHPNLCAQYDSPNTGRGTMALTPAPDNEMCGLSEFRIHGDINRRDGTASEGCMIFDRDVRDQIEDSGDTDLVVEDPVLVIPFW